MTAAFRGIYNHADRTPVRQMVTDYEVDPAKRTVAPPPDPAYFLDLYGACQRRPDECPCLATTKHPDRVWRGRECPHWTPSGATSFDEMIAAARHRRRG